ncbi:MAG: primosomal protein N' [Coprococcus sp.]|nr:primosomal protein N' [Coprococcus sp.]
MFADIIIDITHEKLDKIFQYKVPDELADKLVVGTEVEVPFGRGNRLTRGYVVGFSEVCGYDEEKIKDILRIAGRSVAIESRLVALAAWMKESYGGTMIQALKTVLPIRRTEQAKEQRILKRLVSVEEGKKKLEEYLHKNQKARARLMAALLDDEEIDYSLVTKKLNITLAVVRALEEQKVLEVCAREVYRNPVRETRRDETKPVYTREQKQAIETFCRDYENGDRGTYLLYGVTGSGKTEVYMEMIREVVRMGRQAIVLIPEIALTYQTVMRFYRRFGDRVSIMNSRLCAGERYDQMMRAKRGELDVMIGPRSALFTPFPKLGLIVIDEEHESAYKSEQIPRYHARETAQRRAELEGASVVLGSATPSLEAFYRSQTGSIHRMELSARAAGRELPQVHIADMRKELSQGNRSILSAMLRRLMEDRLGKGQQTMLFLNRRGYAGFLSCRSCGYVVKCPHCDVSLSAHQNGKLVCHYCGHEEPAARVCPSCGSQHISGFRAGTQQIEELVKREFPAARVLRMDLDTTRSKEGHEKILAAFANEEADVLVGTQMIVKGHDFPNVTLVGVLAADLSLYAEDYRAAERTFELLTQAAGRAGRGKEMGQVVIQTYSPEHYSIQTAARQDYRAFYQEEMNYRELMGYPPAQHLLAVLASSEDEALLDKGMYYLKQYGEALAKPREVRTIGPASPHVGKVKDVYRRILYLKHKSRPILVEMKDKMEQYIEINKGFSRIRIQFDFDPVQGF